MNSILYSLIALPFFACNEKSHTEETSQEISISDIEIQELINATEMPEDERSSLEEHMTNLREDCANGDDDACEELRSLIEELEAYREDEGGESEREDEREENERISDECVEESRVAYEDCLHAGGSEEDCRENAAVVYEECAEQ